MFGEKGEVRGEDTRNVGAGRHSPAAAWSSATSPFLLGEGRPRPAPQTEHSSGWRPGARGIIANCKEVQTLMPEVAPFHPTIKHTRGEASSVSRVVPMRKELLRVVFEPVSRDVGGERREGSVKPLLRWSLAPREAAGGRVF